MKKLIVASVASTLCFGLAPAVAMAADVTIGSTGPGSFISVIDENTKKITITCNNDVDVVNINGQNSGSGSATVDGNGYSGDATSGNASNLNDFVVSLGVGCAPAERVTPPPAGGQGGGQVIAAVTPTPAPAAKLPDTGATSVNEFAAAGVALTLGTVAAAVVRRLVKN